MKELGTRRFLPANKENVFSYRLDDSTTITEETISDFYKQLLERFTNELSLLSLHLKINYTAERDGASSTQWASAKRMVVSPGNMTRQSIEEKIFEVLNKLGDGLNGSGWSVIAMHRLDVTYYANIEAFLSADWTGKYFWNVLSPDNHLSYAICSGAKALEKKKNPHKNRYLQYLHDYLPSNRSLSFQAEHFNINIDLYVINEGLLRLSKEAISTNAKGRVIIVEKDGKYWVTTKGLGIDRVKCDKCHQHVKANSVDGHAHKHVKKEIIALMKPEEMIHFRKYGCSLQQKVVVYADFEALNIPKDEAEKAIYSNLFKNERYPKNLTTIHYGVTVCAVLIYDGELMDSYTYTGLDMIDRFVDKMFEWNKKYNVSQFKNVKNVVYDPEDMGGRCFGCGKDTFADEEKFLVRHHDHFTNKFICLAHRSCNAAMKVQKKLPIFFHNFKGYDSKLIIKQLSASPDVNFTKAIAKGKEKFLTFTIEKELGDGDVASLKILDSYAFLSKGLDKLLREDPINALRFTKQVYPDAEPGKGDINFEDYVSFDILQNKDMIDKLEKYCMIDTLGLAGIFTTFCENVYKTHLVDPATVLGAPSLAWQAALKTSGIHLYPYRELDTYCQFRDSIRGGYTNVIKKYAKESTNNKIQYYDINALYSWAMTQPLPHGNFTRVSVDCEDWKIPYNDEDLVCYFIVADWTIPPELADKLSDLPPFAEKVDFKLISDLRDKTNYMTHYRIAQQALGLGLKITKVHEVFHCTQSPFFAQYIYKNVEQRKKFGHIGTLKETFKLLNNALYGKTIENIERYTSINICNTEEGIQRAFNSIDEPIEVGNWIVTSEETEKIATKPTYIGFTVLELSKWKMIDKWYNIFQPLGCKLLYMDTDSFIFESPEGVNCSSGELGEFKDELDGGFILEYSGIRPKTYAFEGYKRKRVDDEDYCVPYNVKKAKGIEIFDKKTKSDVLSFEDYVARIPKQVSQEQIRSHGQQLGTYNFEKYCWNKELDSKRYQCSDGINTLPWGHPAIEETTKTL